MKKALFYDEADDNKVVCRLCNHHCHIKEGRRGICGVRENQGGKLYSLVYGKLISENSDPVEKKPLFHFQAGSRSYSISTVGCNFRCLHCQNFQISQYPRMHEGDIIGTNRSPDAVVEAADRSGCRSISYTYVEPTIFYEFSYDCSILAHNKGLKNIFVSNGYMSTEVARHLAKVLDGINIDIKAFSDAFYKNVCKARLQPVLDNVKLMHDLGVWVEVTTLVIPGLNDSDEELTGIARFINSVNRAIPWHVTAFYPTYQMTDRPPTSSSSLKKARDIGLAEGLRFVYEGNIPGGGGENTYCPACGMELISRFGFSIRHNRLKNGRCPECGEPIQGVWT